MKRTSYALAGLGLAALGLVGCEIVLGLDEREVYRDADASLGGSGGGGGQGGEAGAVEAGPDAPVVTPCVFPNDKDKAKAAGNNAPMRLGSFVAGREVLSVDFCMKPYGETSWAGIVPVMRSWGDECPQGFAYRDYTSQFYMKGGSYDIKLIKAGESCESEGLALAEQVAIEDNKDNQVLAFGDGSTHSVKRFLESRASTPSSYKIRFVHAANGKGAYDFGLSNAEGKIYLPFTSNVSFGNTGKPSGTMVDVNGYTEPQAPASVVDVGAAPTGQLDVDLSRHTGFRTGQSYTVFATGTDGNHEFPPQLWTCNEVASSGLRADKMWAQCGDVTMPKDLKIDVVNTQLNGAFAAFESQRRPHVFDAVSALNSDAVCVSEIWNNADKEALAAAAKGKGFEYSYYTAHDWNTPVDDPTDQNGVVPPPITTAPCASSVDKMNAALDCLRDTCMGKDENAKPDEKFKDCIMGCASTGLLPLITGNDDDKACWSCIFTQSASYQPTAFTREKCATDPKARFVFNGNDGVMVLSKYPIKEPESWVLPATEWRASVLRAPIEFTPEDPTTSKTPANIVDLYCMVLTTPVTSCITRPYTGQYGGESGGGATECTAQWAAELKLQTEKMVAYVKSKSSNPRRAFVAGDFYSGPGYYTQPDNVEVLKEQQPDTFFLLTSNFAQGTPLNYTPQCTFCPPDNAVLTPPGTPTTGSSTWTSNVFLYGFPVTLVQGAEIILKEGVVDIGYKDGDGGALLVPVSPYFGFRSIVRTYP